MYRQQIEEKKYRRLQSWYISVCMQGNFNTLSLRHLRTGPPTSALWFFWAWENKQVMCQEFSGSQVTDKHSIRQAQEIWSEQRGKLSGQHLGGVGLASWPLFVCSDKAPLIAFEAYCSLYIIFKVLIILCFVSDIWWNPGDFTRALIFGLYVFLPPLRGLQSLLSDPQLLYRD